MNISLSNRSKKRFCEILAYFSNATYIQKINFMKEEWGNIAETCIIKYDDDCSIEVGIENNKYYFQFSCENFSVEDLLETVPFYAEDIINLEKDELLNKYNEIVDIKRIENDCLDDNININEKEEQVENDKIILKNDFLNMYNGINIIKKK